MPATFRATQTLFRFVSRPVVESYCADSNISIVLPRMRQFPTLRRAGHPLSPPILGPMLSDIIGRREKLSCTPQLRSYKRDN